MPTIAANQQPTIAIITANYCEKLAVDAMMEQKTTFVKFKTEGKEGILIFDFFGILILKYFWMPFRNS
jgi:hypothetical protein